MNEVFSLLCTIFDLRYLKKKMKRKDKAKIWVQV